MIAKRMQLTKDDRFDNVIDLNCFRPLDQNPS